MNPEQSYRKRYHESATFRRAQRREARRRISNRVLAAVYLATLAGAVAFAATAIMGSL